MSSSLFITVLPPIIQETLRQAMRNTDWALLASRLAQHAAHGSFGSHGTAWQWGYRAAVEESPRTPCGNSLEIDSSKEEVEDGDK